ncbi:MAG: nicotinate-nucleotide--dimethylbenzimidazole phosphoribosyltransferase [Rhizobacter sp.]|nr:nicotinate-nucleotide--dimethylbenzimidazole phosphoribosyltransferase [Chlorobiales bacterium]
MTLSIAALAAEKLDRKTKPQGALGELEILAIRLSDIQQTLEPRASKKRIVIFAADHGVAAEGVSAFPAEVTAQMVQNFLSGGAAISVLSRHGGIELHIADVGVDTVFDEHVKSAPTFFSRSARRGTRNFLVEPAMTAAECEAAMNAGREQVRLAVANGIDLLGIGEMGIGNTTAASALLAALTNFSPQDLAGRGTGVDDAGLRRKITVIEQALKRHHSHAPSADLKSLSARYWLESVGGYEIAAMTGAILETSVCRLPIVIDGFIATAAAAVAFQIDAAAKEVCFFAHLSEEQAHGKVLSFLNVRPVLNLGMRLGEGTGAALAMPVIEAAAKIMCEMSSFDSAGVSERTERTDMAATPSGTEPTQP